MPTDEYGPQTHEVGTVNDLCDIQAYGNGSNLKAIVSAGGTAFSIAGTAEGWNAVARFGLEGINLGNIGEVAAGIYAGQYSTPPAQAAEQLPKVAGAVGCNDPTWIGGMEVLVAIGMVDKFCGTNITEHAIPIKYAINASCRRLFLEPKDALDAYLSNAIDYESFDTHYAIAGLCPTSAQQAVQAGKSKPEPEQLIMMRHRDVITPDVYATSMRQLGYLEPDVAENIFTISEHLPDLGTVTKILQQGATDGATVDKLGLDTYADQLTEGKLAEWIKGNGIDPETAKLFWRAHWNTPGLNSLFEIFHRLRDDDTFNANDELTQQISAAMDSLAIPPYWQTRLMACALSPLLKRDIRFAYTSGTLSDDDLTPALRKTGHNDDAVATIVKELKPARRYAILNHIAIRQWIEQMIPAETARQQLSEDGFDAETIDTAMTDSEFHFTTSSWSESYGRGNLPRANYIQALTDWGVSNNGAMRLADKLAYRIVDHQSLRDYISGTSDRGTVQGEMSTIGMPDPVINKLLDDADGTLTNEFARDCVQGVRQQYVTGGITREEATNYLQGFGLTAAYVHDVVQAFDCRAKADGREIAVEKLCHWLYIGAIDQPDMYQRLLRLGYSEANAALLMVDCVNANTLKAVKQQQQQAKELQSQLAKEQAAVNKVNAANQRQADRLAKMRSDQAKLRGLRQKQYVSAAEKVYKATSVDLSTALATVRDAIASTKSAYGLTEDETLRIAILAADEMKGLDISAYKPLLEQLAAAAAVVEPTPSLADIGQPETSNGSIQPS